MKKFKEKIIKIPLDCLLCVPENKITPYIKRTTLLPKNTYQLLISPRTGSYIVGLTKHHDLPLEKTSVISFLLLKVTLGEITLAQLPSAISAEVQISSEKAQEIASELEKDLLSPIMLELNNYLAQKKKDSKSTSPTEGMGNVVNLKDNPTPKKSLPLPPRK